MIPSRVENVVKNFSWKWNICSHDGRVEKTALKIALCFVARTTNGSTDSKWVFTENNFNPS